mmetsp:Transcript_29713/g.94575  ORF Transcript_29713/g.94575 Transcript_29713/m.94575 type:complete len:209 (+) Transcript_29713:537-1163(+)|eukprot:scaffold16628_cov124-Isochrysis_galbana.AAC.2
MAASRCRRRLHCSSQVAGSAEMAGRKTAATMCRLARLRLGLLVAGSTRACEGTPEAEGCACGGGATEASPSAPTPGAAAAGRGVWVGVHWAPLGIIDAGGVARAAGGASCSSAEGGMSAAGAGSCGDATAFSNNTCASGVLTSANMRATSASGSKSTSAVRRTVRMTGWAFDRYSKNWSRQNLSMDDRAMAGRSKHSWPTRPAWGSMM